MNKALFFIALTLTLICYISSLNAYRLDMPKHFKRLSTLLLLSLLAEIFAYAWPRWLYMYTPFNKSNQWFYNIYHFVGAVFYFYFFHQIFIRPNFKKALLRCSVVYILFALINLFFIQGPVTLNTYSELLANGLLIFASIAYYYQLLFSETIIPVKNSPSFWVCTGIFINSFGSVLAISLINIMLKYSPSSALTLYTLVQIAGLLGSLTFSIAFLCQTKSRYGSL